MRGNVKKGEARSRADVRGRWIVMVKVEFEGPRSRGRELEWLGC